MPRGYISPGTLPLLNDPPPTASVPTGWEFLQNLRESNPIAGSRHFVSTPTVSTITPEIVDLDKDREQENTADMATNNPDEDNGLDLRQFIHKPRGAAVKAARAIRETRWHAPVPAPPAPAPRKRKAAQVKKPAVKSAPPRKASSPESDQSSSSRFSPDAKKPGVLGPVKDVAHRVSKSRRAATPTPPRVSQPRRPIRVIISDSESSLSSLDSEDERLGDIKLEDSESEESGNTEPQSHNGVASGDTTESDSVEDDVSAFAETPVRRISPSTSHAKYTQKANAIAEIVETGEDSDWEVSIKRNVRRVSAPRRSAKHATTAKVAAGAAKMSLRPATLKEKHRNISISPLKAGARTIRNINQTRMPAKAFIRPWTIKSTTQYSSADVDHILDHPPPEDEAEFISHTSLHVEEEYETQTDDKNFKLYHAALIGGTTTDEQELIDNGVERDGKEYELKYRGPAPRLPPHYELVPEDIALKLGRKDKIWKPVTRLPKGAMEVDPPGSGTPLDALKWPNRLIEKANRNANTFPQGWDDDAINSIPDHIFLQIRQDLLETLKYELLAHRPEEFLDQLPITGPYWTTWTEREEAGIIERFVAKVKLERREAEAADALVLLAGAPAVFPSAISTGTQRDAGTAEAADTLLLLSRAPVVFASSAPSGTRRQGIDAPTDFPVECCKECAKSGIECDGAKPSCEECEKKGRKCRYYEWMKAGDAEIELQESYLRSGSDYARQQDWANLGTNNSLSLSDPRLTAQGLARLNRLDMLALAAEVVESGQAHLFQSNPSQGGQNSGLTHGSGPYYTPRLGHDTSRAHPDRTRDPATRDSGLPTFPQEFEFYHIALEQEETLTYMVMTSQEESFLSRPSIRINVPDHLKNLLVDDWENVTKSLLLVPLPSQAPANYIIDDFFNEEKMNRRLGSPEADILEEFCAGLKMYFEKAVGKILLYRFERSQLAEVCTASILVLCLSQHILTAFTQTGPQALGVRQTQRLGRQRTR